MFARLSSTNPAFVLFTGSAWGSTWGTRLLRAEPLAIIVRRFRQQLAQTVLPAPPRASRPSRSGSQTQEVVIAGQDAKGEGEGVRRPVRRVAWDTSPGGGLHVLVELACHDLDGAAFDECTNDAQQLLTLAVGHPALADDHSDALSELVACFVHWSSATR